ncbi:MAG TPA: hypothetical protein VMB19_03870, partial [Silvibacterium sp.]|nr:hypothetical protein [Silvibacterium sp.]
MSRTTAAEVAPELNERALRVLVEASAALVAASDVNTLLNPVLESAKALIGADACGVWRSFDGGYHWRMLTCAGLSQCEDQELSV